MIATTDIGGIMYGECKGFGIADVYHDGNIPESDKAITAERITIHPKSQRPETYWKKGFVEVNLCVPDFKNGKANLIRLQELEREVAAKFGRTDIVGEYDGTPYRYSVDTIGVEEDKNLRCHYVNVRLLFEVYNII